MYACTGILKTVHDEVDAQVVDAQIVDAQVVDARVVISEWSIEQLKYKNNKCLLYRLHFSRLW